MTLRDLSPRQIKQMQHRCEKERRMFARKVRIDYMSPVDIGMWKSAYSKGLTAGLAFAKLKPSKITYSPVEPGEEK